MFSRGVVICLLVLVAWRNEVHADDGFMIRVTAERGEIKRGKQVLATVPRGTRLWAFEVKDRNWARVKVPEREDKGWIYTTQFEQIVLSQAQQARLKEAYAHFDRYKKFRDAHKLTEAVSALRACLAIERDLLGDDHPDVADSLVMIGNGMFNSGDYASARGPYEEALAIRRAILGNQHPDTAGTLYNLGLLSWKQGDYSSARVYYDESLAIYRKILGKGHPDTAMTLNDLGNLVSDQGDYASAQKYYEEALAIYRKVYGKEHSDTAMTVNNLGVLFKKQGDHASARKYYDEALAISRKVLGNEHTSTADTLNNLGNLVSDQGDYASARKFHEATLIIRRNVLGNMHPDTAGTLNNLGLLARDQGDYPSSREYYNEALAIFRKVFGNEHPDTAMTLTNLGNLVSDQGEYASARKYYEEALAINRKVFGKEHPDTASALDNLGILLMGQGEYPCARKYYDEALAIRRKILGNEHPYTANTLENMAWLLADEQDTEGAAEFLDQSRRAVRFHEVRTLPALSEREQVQFLENVHKQDWGESLSLGISERAEQNIADLSAGWLLNGKAIGEEALAERALLSKPETAPLVSRLRAVRAKLAELVMRQAGAARDRQIMALEQEQQQLVREMGRMRGKDLTADPWVAVDAVREAIPAKCLLVNLARFAPWNYKTKKHGDPRYVAWLIPAANQGQTKIIDLGEAQPIDAAVAAFRQKMNRTKQGDGSANEAETDEELARTLATLSDLVWKPLSDEVGDVKELILSPDGSLWLVPWAALPVEDGKFLLEKYSIRYVVSGRELVDSRSADKGAKKSVVMADPDYDMTPAGHDASSQTMNLLARRSITSLDRAHRLSGTAREAKAIEPSLEEYSQTKPIVLLDRDATEGRFKALVSPHVLILGTHGFFFENQEVELKDGDGLVRDGSDEHHPVLTKDGHPIENPLLRCGLLLAGCNRKDDADRAQVDDGVLTGLEIVGTDLRSTELVVLSACDTGVGQIRNGEGVAGLRQAFQLAGAESVVATLWQIPDEETIQLMNDFFGYLADGKSKSDALRYAQLAQIQARRERYGAAHPFYWAAFTITGRD